MIVVLGMDRSGSSLLTNVLHLLGMDLSENLVQAKVDNPKGFFEDRDIVNLNERALKQLLRDEDSPAAFLPTPNEWFRQVEISAIAKEMKAVVQANIERAVSLWGFKDPRTARLLPLWDQVFSALDIEPHYILAIRDPRSVAQSLEKRNGYDQHMSQLRWATLNAEVFTQVDSPVYVVHYENWFEDAFSVAKELRDTFGLESAVDNEDLQRVLSEVIDPTMNHCSKGGIFLADHVAALYEDLKEERGFVQSSLSLAERSKEILKIPLSGMVTAGALEKIAGKISALNRADQDFKATNKQLQESNKELKKDLDRLWAKTKDYDRQIQNFNETQGNCQTTSVGCRSAWKMFERTMLI